MSCTPLLAASLVSFYAVDARGQPAQPTVMPPRSQNAISDPPGELTPADSPASPAQEIKVPVIGALKPESFWDQPLVNLHSAATDLESRTGLKVSMALTFLGQYATAGKERTAAGGDVDFLLRWTALGRGTLNPGNVVFSSEYRWQIGELTPSALSGQIGAGTPTTNGFTEREPVIKDLYFVQHLFDGALRIGAGRADAEGFTTAHAMQSANTFFLHKVFSGNPAVPFPGSGPTLAAGYVSGQAYLAAGFVNAYSKTTEIQIESLFENWDLFSFVEFGWTPVLSGLGKGRYRFAAWNLDATQTSTASAPSDSGVNLIIDQELGQDWNVFARAAWSEANATDVQASLIAGVGLKGLSESGLLGLALGYVNYASDTRSDETIAECFHRWQLTPQVQLTLGGELIIDPADRPDDSAVGVFNLRLRMTF